MPLSAGSLTHVAASARPSVFVAAAACALLAMSAGCGSAAESGLDPGPEGVPEGPQLVLTTRELRLDDVVVGRTGRAAFELTNVGDTLAHVTLELIEVRPCVRSRSLSPLCVDLAAQPPAPDESYVLAPQGALRFEVRYEPQLGDVQARGRLRFTACEGDGCVAEVEVVGTTLDSPIVCEPRPLDFELVPLSECDTRSVRCTNVGGAIETIAGWSVDGPPFRAVEPRSIPLRPTGEASIDVELCGDVLGPRSGRLRIDVEDAATAIEVPLEGVVAAPGRLDLVVISPFPSFGRVAVGHPARLALRLGNVGERSLDITEIAAREAPGIASLRAVDFTPAALEPGETVEVTIELVADQPGALSTLVEVRASDPVSLFRFRVDAEAEDVPPCRFEAASSLAFGSVGVGEPLQLAVELMNVGPDVCFVDSVALTDDGDGAFVLLAAPDVALEPDDRVAFVVRFVPPAAAAFRGELQVRLSSFDTPVHVVEIRGTGQGEADVSLSPREVIFGAIQSGCASTPRTVELIRIVGEPADINALRIEPNDRRFRLVDPPSLPLSLSPGQAVGIDVQLETQVRSWSHAALVIDAATRGGPTRWVVPLQGAVFDPAPRADTFQQSSPPQRRFVLSEPAVPGSVQVFIGRTEVPAVDGNGARNWSYSAADQTLGLSSAVRFEVGDEMVIRYDHTCT